MAKENSQRIQTSILNGLEKKALVRMAKRQPSWMTSDILTLVGVFGAIVIAAGYVLSNVNVAFLWLANLGYLINWYGDSLDGTLARVRNTQRPLYGFYVDHIVDSINEVFMFVGFGLSVLADLRLALMVLVVYLQLTVYVSVCAHLKNEFKLTYGKMGPTEFRLLMIVINLLFMYVPFIRDFRHDFTIFGSPYHATMVDFFSFAILILLTVMFLVSFFKDAVWFSKADPLKKTDVK